MLGGASAFKESGPINTFNSYTHQGRHVEATVLDHPTSTRWVCPVSPWESEDASRAHRRHVAPSGIEPDARSAEVTSVADTSLFVHATPPVSYRNQLMRFGSQLAVRAHSASDQELRDIARRPCAAAASATVAGARSLGATLIDQATAVLELRPQLARSPALTD